MALFALALLAFVAYLPHLRNGGFYLDDWSDVAGTFYPPGGRSLANTLDYFAALFPYRPGLIIYVPFKYWLLGDSPPRQLALAVGLGVMVAFLVYGILRRFRVPWWHAWMIAALLVVYPSFDSVRLWEAASLPSLALVFALGGIWIALVGVDRRSWPLHGVAAALYLISILTYEITLPLIAAAGLLYVLRVGWRNGRALWAVDLAVVVAGGLWNGLNTNREVSSLGGNLEHLGEIVEAGGRVLASTGVAVGSTPPTASVLIVLAAIFVVGAAVCLRGGRRGEGSWGLREWLLLGLGGLVVAALGWAMFIPADPYYTPSLLGITNRVNAVAGIGLVIIVYAAIGCGVSLLGRLLPPLRAWTAPTVVALGVLLGFSYNHVLQRHADVWAEAYRYELHAINEIKTTYPELPPESTLFTSGFPAYLTPGVPIFSATWDLSGMVKAEYEDGSLQAYPLIEGTELVCGPDGVGMSGMIASPYVAPYGSARLLDLGSGAQALPRDREACEEELSSFPPGPLHVTGGY